MRDKLPLEERTRLNAPPNILSSLTQEVMLVLWKLSEERAVEDEKMAATGEVDV